MSKKPSLTIHALLVMLAALVAAIVLAIEATYISVYQQTLLAAADTLMSGSIDELYADIRALWYSVSRISSMISRSEAMRDFVLSPRGGDEAAEQAYEQAIKNVRGIVELAQSASTEVESVMVTDFASLNLFAYSAADQAALAHARNAMTQGLVVRSPVHMQMGQGENAIPYCVNLTDPGLDGEPLYTIMVYNIDPIRQAFAEVGEDSLSVFLIDGTDAAVLANRPYTAHGYDALLSSARKDASPRQQYLQVRRLPLLRWQILAALDPQSGVSELNTVKTFALLTDVFLVIALAAFIWVLKRQIDTPVRRILNHMRLVAAGGTRAPLELGMRNELSAIQDGMNDMFARLTEASNANNRAQERLFALRLAQKQAELTLLTSQINPHFLFNTLDCMRGIAAAGEREHLEKMIDALAALFRYATRGASEVALADEMRAIERYMTIVRIRHGGRITMEYQITPDAGKCLIPKMVLQPLVENAVMHGLEAQARSGCLQIRAWIEDGLLLIALEDNGRGFTDDELARLQLRLNNTEDSPYTEDNAHIGLINIHRRLYLRYGLGCGLTLEARKGGGARVTVRIRAQA